MSVLILLIAVSLCLAAGFTWLCLLSIQGGQFDDLESPRWRVLFDPVRDTTPAHAAAPQVSQAFREEPR